MSHTAWRHTAWRNAATRWSGGTLAACTLLLCASGVAWAAGEGTGDPWRELMWKAVNFLVLAAILWWVARKPIAGMLRGAAREAKARLQGRRDTAATAEAELAEQRRKIEGLEADLQRMVAEAQAQARSERERIVANARAQAERIKASVQMQLEQEFNKARKELQAELARHTVRLAEQQIRDRMDDKARGTLTTQAIAELGAGS